MSDAGNGIYAASTDKRVFVRVVGRGCYLNSQPLRQYLMELMEGRKDFYVDLGQCQSMDSTFLGVLAGFALKLRDNGRLHLIKVSERNLESIRNLGLDQLAPVETGESLPAGVEEPAEFEKLCSADATTLPKTVNKKEISSVMLEAHEDLCRAHEPNEAKFKDVKKFLREEVAAQKESGKGGG